MLPKKSELSQPPARAGQLWFLLLALFTAEAAPPSAVFGRWAPRMTEVKRLGVRQPLAVAPPDKERCTLPYPIQLRQTSEAFPSPQSLTSPLLKPCERAGNAGDVQYRSQAFDFHNGSRITPGGRVEDPSHTRSSPRGEGLAAHRRVDGIENVQAIGTRYPADGDWIA
jgi:hypothetical protein